MGQEAAPGLQRLVHVVSSIFFEELVFARVQSEISRAYVMEMENELEKNPRGAAQAVNRHARIVLIVDNSAECLIVIPLPLNFGVLQVMQLQQQQQDDMRRLQMERFRRLLVNFDDDVTGSPGSDDGEVRADESPYVAESRDGSDANSQEVKSLHFCECFAVRVSCGV
jgi:hypothetical protein